MSRSSLADKTVKGAAWTIAASIGSRGFGLVGTLVLTHFVAPDDYGEVTIAAVLALTANQLSSVGVGQFLVAKKDSDEVDAFHALVVHLVLGVVALSVLWVSGTTLAQLLSAPGAPRFLPGLLAATFIDRIGFVPERLLVRDLRFRAISLIRTASEVAYTATAVALAVAGWGAMAIVLGNLGRALVRSGMFVACVRWQDWLCMARLRAARFRRLLEFGLPLWVAACGAFASRRWDNLIVSGFFGPAAAGLYNLAYNLADVPAVQVGEQIGDVLLPSFTRMSTERRRRALVRSLNLLALTVFPLAVGLAVTAPTVVALLFDERWQAVAPMLFILAGLSVTRPVSWTIFSYLQARMRPRLVMYLELSKLVALLALLSTLGRKSVQWACVAVGIGFLIHMLASLFVVRRIDGIASRDLAFALLRPTAACIPMALVVYAIQAWTRLPAGASLVVQVGCGALSYVLAAFAVAPSTTKDLWHRMAALRA